MSRLPKVNKKPKNNRSTKFRWVDMQWERFMTRHDEDTKIIKQLQDDLITCNKYFQKQREDILQLEMENAEIKDMVLDLGGDYEKESNDWEITNDTGKGDFEVEKPMIYESPDGGKTIYSRRAGDYGNEKLVTNPNQMELFKD
jgi:hypothetical protein